MNKKTLCVIGSINVDYVIQVSYFAGAGETLQGRNFHLAYGGKGANQAVAAARLGAEVQFIGAIGDDAIGQTMKQAFADDGIRTDTITTVPNQSTGLAMIQVADSGENSIVIAAGANADLTEEKIRAYQTQIATSAILLTQLETPLQAVESAAQFAKQAGTTVVLNPAPARPLPDSLLAQIDIITPNETETEILTGVKIVDELTACQAAHVFHQKGIATVIITLGAKGVYLSEKGQGQHIAGFKVNAIDTTAAGDTFNGGLVTALLEGKSMIEAVKFAQKAAALSVTRRGAQSSIPYRREVDES
ncbi:ribokinase [Muribacter muris]|uniref:Ribokinase n=1 Tax=Muribacter muris TaxID=67855 RepID=A0A4Y9K8W3_9PAST|nr:ribokinase [Muribacter muris]MBF0784027.1 ribokinase [Muribacter muris]MBF0827522.1 ribokinase [Muribacter muris]TFV13085.1 ribokinase [Muribacter muris]